MAIQKKIFTSGINSDTTDELLSEGMDRYRLNVRVLSSDNSTVGAIETVKGNTLVSFALPSGTNKVIGAEEDLLRKKLYYFVHNSTAGDPSTWQHSILEFDEQSVSVKKVFQSPILNFKEENLITGIDIIELDEDNHLLYWTDNWVNENDPFEYNEPKKINIEKGKFFMDGDFVNGYPSPFDPENLFRIKQPMLCSPLAVYGDDPNMSVNRLDKKLFQFKVQFVYDDKEVSAWSPYSKTAFPLSNEIVKKNNVINVTVDTGIEIVKRIRIAFKEVSSSDFFLVIDLDKDKLGIASNSTYVYKFYNDGNDSILEVNESIKLYDRVPKRSQSQGKIDGIRLCDGLITEEFDPVDIDLKIDYELNNDTLTYSVDYIVVVSGGKSTNNFEVSEVTISGDGSGATAELVDAYVSDYTIYDRGFACIADSPSTDIYGGNPTTQATADADYDGLGRLENGNPPYGIVITNGGAGYTICPSIAFYTTFNTAEPSAILYITARRIKIINAGSGYTTASATINNFFGSVLSVALTAKNVVAVNSLKRGGVYTYGVVYYDHGNRSGLTNINEGRFDTIQSNGRYGTTLFIPFYTESNPIGGAELSFTMKIDSVAVLDGGTSYTGATSILFSSPVSGVTATGSAIIGVGKVIGLTMTDAGAGYTPDGNYTVNLLGGAGSAATINITIILGVIDSFQIVNQGTGYLDTDVLTVDPSTFAPPPSVDGSFTINSDYQEITGVLITNSGSGYTSMPTITVTDSGGGTLASLAPLMKVDAVSIVSGSSGYTSAPTAEFVGGSPSTAATLTTTITSGVVTSTSLTNAGVGYVSFPELSVESRISGGSYPIVGWSLYNAPPSWATHAQIVRAKNSANGEYIQFVIESISYLDKKGVSKTFGDPEIVQMAINVSNIYTEYLTQNPGSILSYDFSKGQRIRFRNTTEYYDFEIGGFNSGTGVIYVTLPEGSYPGIPQFVPGNLFEIYQPTLDVPISGKLTYEIGECLNILTDSNGNRYHTGNVSNQSYWDFNSSSNVSGFVAFSGDTQHGLLVGTKIKINQNIPFVNSYYNTYVIVSAVVDPFTIRTNLAFGLADPNVTGTITSAATGSFTGGDTFYRPRTMSYSNEAGFITSLIEDANYSDLFLSPGYDYGRPNRIDPQITEITRPGTVYYSENLIPETNINGLSSVFDTNFETYDSKYGGIYKLYGEDSNLLIFQELKIANIPVNKLIYNDLQGGTSVGASESVLSQQAMYYAGEFGIGKHPESFAVYSKSKYGIDVRRGTPWRLSVDGLTPIGDTGLMHNYFNDKCKEILSNNSKVNIYGTYDIRFNEYVIAFDSIGNILPETIAWNEKANGWSTFYSYSPEYMSSNGLDIVSFKGGDIYIHNTNVIQNNFYGIQYPSEVWSILNAEPSSVKIFEAIGQESLSVWEVPEISNTNGQLSNLISDDFQMKEGMQYAPVWRDINTPNIIAPSLPLFEGDVMRAQTFLVKFRYNGIAYNKIFAVNYDYIISNLHKG